jgi:hypothetical protein
MSTACAGGGVGVGDGGGVPFGVGWVVALEVGVGVGSPLGGGAVDSVGVKVGALIVGGGVIAGDGVVTTGEDPHAAATKTTAKSVVSRLLKNRLIAIPSHR